MQFFNEKEIPATGFGTSTGADPYLQWACTAMGDDDTCSTNDGFCPVNDYIDAFFANKENVPPNTKQL